MKVKVHYTACLKKEIEVDDKFSPLRDVENPDLEKELYNIACKNCSGEVYMVTCDGGETYLILV